MKHETLNNLIKENGYKSYLEIGYGSGYNFEKIKCNTKKTVDPSISLMHEDYFKMSSDDFFSQNEEKFDIIHIDGDHNHEQVEKDIINAYSILNKGGMLVLHDIKPHNKEMQECPRNTKQWTGDVWRSWVGFIESYPKINTEYIEETYGLGVIKKTGMYKVKEGFTNKEMTFEEFEKGSLYGTI